MANGFLTGLARGFVESGGPQRLSNYAARNIGEGEYYDPYQDEQFVQKYEIARQTGTPQARQEFADQYGDYLDVPEDMSATEYMFEPAEGTPQAREQRMNELQLQLRDVELERAEQNLEGQQLQQEMAEFEFDQMQERAPYENQQMRMETNLMQEYLPQQYEYETDTQRMQRDMTQEELNQMQDQNPYSEMDPIQLSQIAASTPGGEEVWQQTPYSQFGTAEEFLDAMSEGGLVDGGGEEQWSDFIDRDDFGYVGVTPDENRYPVLESARGGRIAVDEKGKTIDWSNKEVANEQEEVTEDAGYILYSHPLISNEVAEQYAGQEMSLTDINKLVQSHTPEYDISDMMMRDNFSELFQGSGDREEYEKEILGGTSEAGEGSAEGAEYTPVDVAEYFSNYYEGHSPEQIASAIENSSDEEREQFEDITQNQFGVPLEAVVEELRRLEEDDGGLIPFL